MSGQKGAGAISVGQKLRWSGWWAQAPGCELSRSRYRSQLRSALRVWFSAEVSVQWPFALGLRITKRNHRSGAGTPSFSFFPFEVVGVPVLSGVPSQTVFELVHGDRRLS
jgi:hypothetical protein